MLSPGGGYKWEEKNKIIGQTITKIIEANTLVNEF